MDKKKIITIVENMGFRLDYDQWDGKKWMRFKIKDDSLDERDLRLIWWKDTSDETNFGRAADILFKAGQKRKIQSIRELTIL